MRAPHLSLRERSRRAPMRSIGRERVRVRYVLLAPSADPRFGTATRFNSKAQGRRVSGAPWEGYQTKPHLRRRRYTSSPLQFSFCNLQSNCHSRRPQQPPRFRKHRIQHPLSQPPRIGILTARVITLQQPSLAYGCHWLRQCQARDAVKFDAAHVRRACIELQRRRREAWSPVPALV